MPDTPCPCCDGDGCHHCGDTGKAPRIAGSALLTREGILVSLPAPARHHHVIHHMSENGYSREQIARSEQGFVTDSGQFVGRVPAKMLAQDAGQIIRDSSGGRRELFSEDVW